MAEFVQSKISAIEPDGAILVSPESLETFWNELGDIPVDDDGIIQETFLWWPEGTDREDIWHWFDEKYPGRVVKLMGLETQSVIDKLCEIGHPGFILTRKELEQLLEDQ